MVHDEIWARACLHQDPELDAYFAEKARREFLHFCTFTYPGKYVVEPAHALIAEKLTDVFNGKIKQLMIFAPPQHGKSELVSVRFPAWWLGHKPQRPVILTSYGADLAHEKSGECRDVVAGLEYQRVFKDRVLRSKGSQHWQLKGYRGGMLAAGVRGPVTGRGAGLIVIDDPFKDWEEAQSSTVRRAVWNWYRGTLRTRLWEGGAIVLIMTRWNTGDLAGELLDNFPGQWEVLRLPAIAEDQATRDDHDEFLGLPTGNPDPLDREPGEALCPLRYSISTLTAIRDVLGDYIFGAEYQGVPRAPEGNLFKRPWFPIVDASPSKAQRVRLWDKAATAGGGNASAGVLMAEADGVYYVEDSMVGHWSAKEREDVIEQMCELDNISHNNTVLTIVEKEGGSGGVEQADATITRLAGHQVEAIAPTGSKEVRSYPLRSQAEAHNVLLVKGDWNKAWLDEICVFPFGNLDDQVDATTGAFNKLAQMRRDRLKKERNRPRATVRQADHLRG